MSNIFLSVVIPSYNEMANLRKDVLEKVKHFLDKKKIAYEVIVVDDGSTDGSDVFVKEFVKENKTFALLENSHTGKAGTVTAGMLASRGKYIVFTDMDQATPIEEVDTLLPYLAERGYDIAIGSRSTGHLGYPLSRQIQHDANILLRKMIVGLPELNDTQCGFKMFTREAAHAIFSSITKIHNGFKKISTSAVHSGFDVELLLIAKSKGFRIKEVPIHWLYVESRRVSPVRDSIDGILSLFRIRAKKIQGRYR